SLRHAVSPSQSSPLSTDHFRQPAARGLPRFGNTGVRSPRGREYLLLHAHAEQRCDQLLGFEQKCADKVFGIGWIPRTSAVEAIASGRSRQTYGTGHPGRAETGNTVSSALRSATHRRADPLLET